MNRTALVAVSALVVAWTPSSKSTGSFTVGTVTVRQMGTAPENHVGDGVWHVSDVNDHSLGRCRAGDLIEVAFTGSWTAGGGAAMEVVVFENGDDPSTMVPLAPTTVQTTGTIQRPLGTPFAAHGVYAVEHGGDCRVALRYAAAQGQAMTVNYTASEVDSGGSFVATRRAP